MPSSLDAPCVLTATLVNNSTFRSISSIWVLLVLALIAGWLPFAEIAPVLGYLPGLIVVVLSAISAATWVGWTRSLALLIGITALGFVAEILGTQTGLVFGVYHYADVLNGPLWFGVPPVTMSIYFGLGWVCLVMARSIASDIGVVVRTGRLLAISALAALFMTVHDLSTDPSQSTIGGLWVWDDGGAWFGVPYRNFVGWFVVTFIMSAVMNYVVNSSVRSGGEVQFRDGRYSNRALVPVMLSYLVFELPTMVHPLLHVDEDVRLSLSLVAVFACSIPVLAAVLGLGKPAHRYTD